MTSIKFYKYAAGLLVLLNLSLIGFFLLTRPKPPGFLPPPHPGQHKHFQNRAVDILRLDREQHHAFLASADQHRQQMRTLNQQQRDLLKPYFYSLVDTEQALDKERILEETQLLDRKKIEATYEHFDKIKSILREDQKPDFEAFMNQAIGRILLNTKKDLPPPKDL